MNDKKKRLRKIMLIVNSNDLKNFLICLALLIVFNYILSVIFNNIILFIISINLMIIIYSIGLILFILILFHTFYKKLNIKDDK